MKYTDEQRKEYNYRIHRGPHKGHRAKLPKLRGFQGYGYIRIVEMLTEDGPKLTRVARSCMKEDMSVRD